jgi:hypothetical protein
MKGIACTLVAAVIGVTIAFVALAAQGTLIIPASGGKPEITIAFEPGTENLNLDELHAFDTAQHADSAIANQLAISPALVADSAYVEKHPALREFLERYPLAREQIQANPGNYVVPLPGSTWNRSLFRDGSD